MNIIDVVRRLGELWRQSNFWGRSAMVAIAASLAAGGDFVGAVIRLRQAVELIAVLVAFLKGLF